MAAEILMLGHVGSGRIVEIVDGPAHNLVASGRIYMTVGKLHTGAVTARKRFTGEQATLSPTLNCRDVSDDIDRPNWRF